MRALSFHIAHEEDVAMDSFDFSPLFRSTIGFDRLMRLADSATRVDTGNSYPPYNIESTGENAYRLTMAVAGFSSDDLEIVVQENTLVIAGKAQKDVENAKYLHRGIARRAFERRFQLADHLKVAGASLDNGLLHVDLVREVPETLKPRKVAIEAGPAPKVIEQKAAA
jgi:molecular chaperone IbpA